MIQVLAIAMAWAWWPTGLFHPQF